MKVDENWVKTHIVSQRDVVDSTSPVYKILKLVDDCVDTLNKCKEEIEIQKKIAVKKAMNNRERLTVMEWDEKYINPIENLIFNIVDAIYQVLESE